MQCGSGFTFKAWILNKEGQRSFPFQYYYELYPPLFWIISLPLGDLLSVLSLAHFGLSLCIHAFVYITHMLPLHWTNLVVLDSVDYGTWMSTFFSFWFFFFFSILLQKVILLFCRICRTLLETFPEHHVALHCYDIPLESLHNDQNSLRFCLNPCDTSSLRSAPRYSRMSSAEPAGEREHPWPFWKDWAVRKEAGLEWGAPAFQMS